ncbi:MAG: App1 family protein [Micrococcaceae bacterium]
MPGPDQLPAWVYGHWQRYRRRRRQAAGDEPTILSFTGYGTTSWVRVLARVILAPGEEFVNGRRLAPVIKDGVRGWRNFISPPLAFHQVDVEVAGHRYPVRADRNGVIDAVIPAQLSPGWTTAQVHVAGGDSSSVDVIVVDEAARQGVICDIDDTIVVTALPRPLLASWNSFVLDEHARTPTPGMSVLLNRLLDLENSSPAFYVSTGAWNVAQALTRFLTRNLYPLGPLLLTSWGPTEDRVFRSGMEHKHEALDRLSEDFPETQWILVGDDGQHDPEIYASFARRHPGRVRAIVIRQLTPSEALLAGGRAAETRHTTPGVPWVYGPDGAALTLQLEELGILNPDHGTGSPQAWPHSVRTEETESVERLQMDFPLFTQDFSEADVDG